MDRQMDCMLSLSLLSWTFPSLFSFFLTNSMDTRVSEKKSSLSWNLVGSMLFIMRSRWIKLLPNRIFLVTNSITMHVLFLNVNICLGARVNMARCEWKFLEPSLTVASASERSSQQERFNFSSSALNFAKIYFFDSEIYHNIVQDRINYAINSKSRSL